MQFNSRSSFLLSLLVTFAVQCTAKLLLETIPTFPELSQLQGYIERLPRLSAQLKNVDNYTFLAPTNDAFDSFLASDTTLDEIEATLFYHLLHGIHPVASFTEALHFVPSFLTNSSYTNVTDGQNVQLSLSNSGSKLPLIRSGNRTTTSITTPDIVATGGLVQIVSSVLQIPQREPIVVRDAKLSFFIALLTKGGFLTTERDDFTTKITNLPDTIYFIPNTASALAQFSNQSSSISTEGLSDLLEYHVVSNNLLYSTDLKDGMNLTTLEGRNLTIRVMKDGRKFVNGARILQTDFLIANGVLHTIDALLDPNNITAPEISAPSSPSISRPVIAGIAISIIVFVLLASGIAFYLLRRRRSRNTRPLKLDGSPMISYPKSGHELGGRDERELGLSGTKKGRGGGIMHESGDVSVYVVELDASRRTRTQVWELESPEEVRGKTRWEGSGDSKF